MRLSNASHCAGFLSAATVVMRIPIARERLVIVTALLILGLFGGFLSLVLVDPITVNQLHAAFDQGASERLDAIAAGGAALGHDGVLADTENAPAFVLGHARGRGILGPESESFALAMLFARIDTPFVAVPDPQSTTGANDRLDKAFPSLFREGQAGYRIIYQNNTWRLFARLKAITVSEE